MKVQRMFGLLGGALWGLLPAVAYAHGGEETVASAPLWLGIVMLGGLMAAFAAAIWWFYFSPISEPVPQPKATFEYLREKQRLMLLYLAGVAVIIIGGMWDIAGHIKVGLLVDDFFWPSHLVLYGGFGVTALVGLFGLLRVLRIPGSLRARFRAEPLYGLLALTSLFQSLSGPSDEVWHQIIGRDLLVWSLPHTVLLSGILLTVLVAAAIQSNLMKRGEEQKLPSFTVPDLALAAFLAVTLWAISLYAVYDWEAFAYLPTYTPDNLFWSRPGWLYPVLGLASGAFALGVAQRMMRRIGAATTVTLAFNIWNLAIFSVLAATGHLVPLKATQLFYIPAALALDALYWRKGIDSQTNRVTGALLFGAIFLTVSLPTALTVTHLVNLNSTEIAITVVVGLAAGVVAHLSGYALGGWLRDLPVRVAARYGRRSSAVPVTHD